MNCKDIKFKISDYIDGLLDDIERKDFEKHISSCLECSRLLNDILIIEKEVKRIKIPKPNPFIFERVKARLKEGLFPRTLVLRFAFATSLSILLVFTISFHFIKKEKEQFVRKYIKELYIIQEKSSGYQIPVYNVENNYIVKTGRSETF